MKEGDLIALKNIRNYDGDPLKFARLIGVDEHSVEVRVEGIGGYFVFSKDCVAGVIDEATGEVKLTTQETETDNEGN